MENGDRNPFRTIWVDFPQILELFRGIGSNSHKEEFSIPFCVCNTLAKDFRKIPRDRSVPKPTSDLGTRI